MSYRDYLATRPGYRFATVERTVKQPGDLVLHRVDRDAERVPACAAKQLKRKVALA